MSVSWRRLPTDREALQPVFERHPRRETDGALQRTGIGEGMQDITRLPGQQFQFGFTAQARLQQGDIAAQVHRAIAADVVEPPGRSTGRRVRRLVVPARIGRWRGGQQPDQGFHDVVHVGEVALVLAKVEQTDRTALDDGLGKQHG